MGMYIVLFFFLFIVWLFCVFSCFVYSGTYPSVTDTIGPQYFVQDVPNSGASGRRGMCNLAVEYNVAAFSELSFAVRCQGGLSRGYYYE